jgi:hypothetical protein
VYKLWYAQYTTVVQFFVFKEFLVLVVLTLLTVFVGFWGADFSLILSGFKNCDFCFGNYFQIQQPSSLVCLRTGFNSYVHIPRFEML